MDRNKKCKTSFSRSSNSRSFHNSDRRCRTEITWHMNFRLFTQNQSRTLKFRNDRKKYLCAYLQVHSILSKKYVSLANCISIKIFHFSVSFRSKIFRNFFIFPITLSIWSNSYKCRHKLIHFHFWISVVNLFLTYNIHSSQCINE